MRNDYEPYFRQLKAALTGLGYVSVRERELDAEFELYSGWKLSFEGERYSGPMFGLFVVTPNRPENRQQRYEVGLLMQSFENLFHKSYGKPTIENQVDFLIREKDRVFGNTSLYEGEYSKLNNLGP